MQAKRSGEMQEPAPREAATQLASARFADLDHLVNHSPRMAAQRRHLDAAFGPVAQRQPAPPNLTGMPDGLKAGIESLSGMDMSAVRVHRNSSQPAQLNAQGNDIHLGPGQEQHLPHEAWHVVQQRQGRVQATMQMAGVGVNDDLGLEREADVMGGWAGHPVAQLSSKLSIRVIGRILPGLPANGKSAKVVKQLIEEAQGLLSADEQLQNDSSDAEKIVGWFYEKLLEKQCFDDIRELHTPLLLSLKELEDTEAFEAIPVRSIALEAYKKFQLVEQLQQQQQLPMKMEHELLEELPVEEENPLEKYQFPEALYEKVKEQKKSVEGGLYLYDYDKTKMEAKQNPKGREMRRKEHLVKSGEWTNEESRKQLELSVEGGVLKGVLSGKEKAGIVQYALSPDWKLYGKTQEELNAIKSKASVAHTALLAGGDVRCAGWIVTDNGKITRVGNDSGHYRPVRPQLHQVLAFLLAGGVKLAEISVQDAEDEKAINGADYFEWLNGGMKGPLPNGKKSENL